MNEGKHRGFWNVIAPVYELIIRKDGAAYKRMYRLIEKRIVNADVLELACGTGLISRNVANVAKSYTATDFAADMIEQAKKRQHPPKICFEMQNAEALTYKDAAFDVILISNALHIMPHPQQVLSEISRVLKDNGILIAPTFSHLDSGRIGKMRSLLMQAFGLPVYHSWTVTQFKKFLESSGFTIAEFQALHASFEIAYAVCQKKDVLKDIPKNCSMGERL